MNTPNKQTIFKLLVILLNCSVISIFIFSLFIMTSDAQGVFVFIFTLPIIITFSFFSIFLSNKIEIINNYFLKLSKFIIVGLCLFSVSGLIPGLNQIPTATTDFLIQGFVHITGKTPKQYFKDRNSLEKLIQNELLITGKAKIDISKMDTAHRWTKFCIFTPYTSDLVADQLVGINFKLSQYSDIASNDGIHVVALFDEQSLVNYVNLKRSIVDFDFTDSICVSRAAAILYQQSNNKFAW